jgi:hypothetical protein
MASSIKQEVSNLNGNKLPDNIQKLTSPLKEHQLGDHMFQHDIEKSKRKPEIEIKEETYDSDECFAEEEEKSKSKKIKLRKITYWNLRIISGMSKLKEVEDKLFDDPLVKNIRGQYENHNFNGASSPSLHITVRFSQQMRRTGVMKKIHKFFEDETAFKLQLISLHPPGMKAKIQKSLNSTTNLSERIKDTNLVNKGGIFLRKIFSKEDLEEKAKSLILEKGEVDAEYECCAQGMKKKMFEKAKEEIEWAEALNEQKKRQSAAEKYVESLYPWQKFLLEELEKVADDRTIWLVLDKKGATGKSHFQRIVSDKNPKKVLMIPDDNKRDILNLAANHKNYEIVFMNIARQTKTKNIDLAAVENIKDGYVSSGKYGGTTYRTTKHPHVVLFSNKPPPFEDLSEDRWKIINITAEPKMAWKDNVFEVLTLSEYLSSTTQDMR